MLPELHALFYAESVSVVTSGHVTKMAVTPFDPPNPKTAPLKGRNTNVCMWGEVPDVITPVKFNIDRFRGF